MTINFISNEADIFGQNKDSKEKEYRYGTKRENKPSYRISFIIWLTEQQTK